jgi:hypothetical protein
MRITSERLALWTAVLFTLLVFATLCLLAKRMRPVSAGTSDGFWSSAVAVAPHGGAEGRGIAVIEGSTAYYAPPSMDSAWLYEIPRERVMADWPLVLRALDARAAAGIEDDAVARGYQTWKTLAAESRNVDHLIGCIDDAIALKVGKELSTALPANYFTAEHDWLRVQAGKTRRYWANFLFELLFLAGLGWFALWPLIHKCSFFRTLIHLAITPSLFLAPAWMGYCGVCANGVGPAGGILYPWLITFIHPFQFDVSWDQAFFRWVPKWLDGLNQSPAWSLDEMLRFFPVILPGPLEAALAGVGPCILFAVARVMVDQVRQARLRRRGFEVLPTPTASSTAPESVPRDSEHL